MQRGVFSRSVALGVGAAILLVYASAAGAFDAGSYYPLKPGVSWTYDVERRLTMSAGLERFERHLEGWAEECVIGVSGLSTPGKPVYKVRRRVELTDGSTASAINREYVMHMSASKYAVRTHGLDSHVHKRPQVFLKESSEIDFNQHRTFRFAFREELEATGQLVNIRQLGKMWEKSALKSQTREKVKVPAGSFRRAIKNTYGASVYGELGGHRIRVGTSSGANWFAKGVGLVRQFQTYYIKFQTPEGDVTAVQTETWRLSSYKLPTGGLRGE